MAAWRRAIQSNLIRSAHPGRNLAAAPIFIDDSAGVTVLEMRAKARRLKAEHGIVPEVWGGDNIFVEASAKKRIGLDNFLDMLLLVERLKSDGDFEAIGGAAYLGEIAQSVPYAANAVYYARIVRDKATQRALIHASTEILRDAYDPALEPREMLNRVELLVKQKTRDIWGGTFHHMANRLLRRQLSQYLRRKTHPQQ